MVKRLFYPEIKAKDKITNGQNSSYIIVINSNTPLGHGISFFFYNY
jgi:hypothetical protein